MSRKISTLLCVFLLCLGTGLSSFQCLAKYPASSYLSIESYGLDAHVYQLAVKAHNKAAKEGTVKHPHLISIIDYSKPSHQKRMWVIDLRTQKVLHHTYVAHGRNSGDTKPNHFSNVHGSLKSSLGVFKTGQTYYGAHGRSLKIHGLEPKFNSNAFNRHIVVHGSDYVSEQAAKEQRVGRSHGCPAIPHAVAQKVIDTIEGGSLMFIYYPDKAWLERSTYLV